MKAIAVGWLVMLACAAPFAVGYVVGGWSAVGAVVIGAECLVLFGAMCILAFVIGQVFGAGE